MKHGYIFLAPGFEEIEALTPVDLLRRAGIDILTVGIGGKTVTGSHGITVSADHAEGDAAVDLSSADFVILPGGMPGTLGLDASDYVRNSVMTVSGKGGYVCAICAAPRVIGKLGLLSGKKATCYPGNEQYLEGADATGERVVIDGKYITAKAAGTATEFALAIISELTTKEEADKIAASIFSR